MTSTADSWLRIESIVASLINRGKGRVYRIDSTHVSIWLWHTVALHFWSLALLDSLLVAHLVLLVVEKATLLGRLVELLSHTGRALLTLGLWKGLGSCTELGLVNESVTIIILIILHRVSIDREHVWSLHQTSRLRSMGYIFATVSLLALISMPIAIICVIDCAAQRLKIRLLSVAIRGIEHSHFHIC